MGMLSLTASSNPFVLTIRLNLIVPLALAIWPGSARANRSPIQIKSPCPEIKFIPWSIQTYFPSRLLLQFFPSFLTCMRLTFLLITFERNELESCATSQIIGNSDSRPLIIFENRLRFCRDNVLSSRFLQSYNCLFSTFLESKKFTFILITFEQNKLESCTTSQIVGNWNAVPNLSYFFEIN